MPVLLDQIPVTPTASPLTLEAALQWARFSIPAERVLVKIELDGQVLDPGQAEKLSRKTLEKSTLSLATADRKQLALTTIGKLAALIDWLSPQHRDTAAMLERGQAPKALERLGGIISAWQQIQQAYGNLARMLNISVSELSVRQVTGETILADFCKRLEDIQGALQNRDLVMLADILQYEMDAASADWLELLGSTLAVVEPVAA